MWFDSKCEFAPPTILLELLFCFGVSLHSCFSAYCLTGVSLTLGVGYLHMVSPVKCSHHSWPWMWGISSEPLQHHTATAHRVPGGGGDPAMQKIQEMQVPFLGQEEPLEWEMTTHSNILAWEIPWTEGLVGSLEGHKESELLSMDVHSDIWTCYVLKYFWEGFFWQHFQSQIIIKFLWALANFGVLKKSLKHPKGRY